jgi:polyadenylate-binding protein
MQQQIGQLASLYVGNLANDVTEGILFEIFKRCGAVNSIRVCRDYITKRSLGYAYVNFISIQDAQRAIDTLNNTQIKGKYCRIMWTRRDPSERKNGKGNIFIKGLDPHIGQKELHDTFSQFGNILSCKVATTPNGESKGYGYVHYDNPDNARQAISIVNNKRIGNQIVKVEAFVPRGERTQNSEDAWTNVFVKNVENSVSDAEFRELFEKYGTITSMKLTSPNPKFATKMGFLNYESNKNAVDSVNEMNNKEYKGFNLFVSKHQKRHERLSLLRKEYEIRKRETIKKYQGLNLYVKYIEDNVDEETIRKEFEKYGKITSLKIMRNDKGVSKGFGFVCYEKQEEAQNAYDQSARIVLPNCIKPLYVAFHEGKEIRSQRLQQFRSRSRSNYNPNMYGVPYNPYSSQSHSNNPQRSNKNRTNQGNQTQTQQTQSTDKEAASKLYELVQKLAPQNADRVTGLILNSEGISVEKIENLVSNEFELKKIVDEAQKFLAESPVFTKNLN